MYLLTIEGEQVETNILLGIAENIGLLFEHIINYVKHYEEQYKCKYNFEENLGRDNFKVRKISEKEGKIIDKLYEKYSDNINPVSSLNYFWNITISEEGKNLFFSQEDYLVYKNILKQNKPI
jgi:hypothetical protein